MTNNEHSLVGGCSNVLDAIVTREAFDEGEQNHIARCEACQELIAVKRALHENLDTVPFTAGRKTAWISGAQERLRRRRRRAGLSALGLATAAASSVVVWMVSCGTPGPAVVGNNVKETPTSVVAHHEQRPTWVQDYLAQYPSHPPVEGGPCSQLDNGIKCVSVSPYEPSRERALTAAREKNLDALIQYLDKHIDAQAFKDGSRAIYGDWTPVKLLPWVTKTRRPKGMNSGEARADAQHRARLALAAVAPPSSEAQSVYWEEFADDDGGSKFKGYARHVLDKETIESLIRVYTNEHEWGGATVMTAFPFVAFRHGDFEGGVIVTGKGTDRLPPLSVITEINGNPIRRAEELTGFSPHGDIKFAKPIAGAR